MSRYDKLSPDELRMIGRGKLAKINEIFDTGDQRSDLKIKIVQKLCDEVIEIAQEIWTRRGEPMDLATQEMPE